MVAVTRQQLQVPPALTEVSPTFPYLYHHDKIRRRNGQKCMGISVTALVLMMKYPGGGRAPPCRRRCPCTAAAAEQPPLMIFHDQNQGSD